MGNKTGLCCVCGLEFEKKIFNAKHCSDICRGITKKNYADKYNKSYYVKNSEKIKASTKAYAKDNELSVKEYHKKYRDEHKDERSERQFNYRKDNPILLEKKRKYYIKNKGILNKKNTERQKKNWDKIKESDRYFKNIFCHRYKIRGAEIPQEILESYKLYVKLKREVRSVKTNGI